MLSIRTYLAHVFFVYSVDWDQTVPSDSPDHVSDIDPANGDKYESAGILVIKVIDTGPGLSPDQQEQMFQEGVQFNPNELQGGQGSGLGLWISREIIQQHGGTIDVMSPGLGKGSTFTMSLPVIIPSISKSHASSCRHSMSHEEIERLSLLPLRVLVVDDSKVNARMLSRLLQNAGMKVSVVYSGEECIEFMSDSCNHDIEMIVMDFIMPIMSGPEAARILRASGHSIPIIGVTGNVLPEDIKCFKEAGANEVLVKPLILSKFLAVCKEVTLSGNNNDRFVSP
jgi:CheY-like chemotaxis protein